MRENKKRIAFLIPNLYGGGIERVIIALLQGFIVKGFSVDLLLINEGMGISKKEIPSECRIINLRARRALTALLPLQKYLKQEKPDILITAATQVNAMALLTKVIFRLSIPIIVTEHSTFFAALPHSKRLITSRFLPFFMRWLYPRSSFVVGVSKGVIEDLKKILGDAFPRLRVIYNPILDQELPAKAEEPLDHPWFFPSALPVILGVGRLTKQKDFPTLIRAFSLVREKHPSRLVILGEGEDRPKLEALAEELGLKEDVWMPGFVANPYKYMKRASVFVLSSLWEGLPTVLVEAIACGCPVVSTDCPSGPREILEDGQWGKLVPIGDIEALADAIFEVLAGRDFAQILSQKEQERAREFTKEKAIDEYTKLVEEIFES